MPQLCRAQDAMFLALCEVCSGLEMVALSRAGHLPPEAAWQGLDAACYSNVLQITKVALHMDRRTETPILTYCWAILTSTTCQMDLFWPVSKI